MLMRRREAAPCVNVYSGCIAMARSPLVVRCVKLAVSHLITLGCRGAHSYSNFNEGKGGYSACHNTNSRTVIQITKTCTLALQHVYLHTYVMLSTFTLATVTQLLAAELMLQPHSEGSKLGNHIYSKATK